MPNFVPFDWLILMVAHLKISKIGMTVFHGRVKVKT
jgi:hypothetical protein